MPQRVQTLRSSTKNTRPAQGTREPGELYTSFPDLQLGVIDTAKAPKDLIAVRYFSPLTDYAIGDFIINAGTGYRAKVAITAGAFNAANWDTIATTQNAEPPIAAGTVSQYWRGDKIWATLDKAAVGLGNVDNTSDATKPVSGPAAAAIAAGDALRVLKAGDTMTGALKLPEGGSAGSPILAFGTDGSGLYTTGSSASLNLRFAVNGGNGLHLTATSVNANNPLYAVGGNSTNPGIAFAAEPGSGWYWAAAGNVRQVIQGTVVWQSTVTGIQSNVPVTLPADPTAALQAATKQYVDAKAAAATFPEAPNDGLTYGRKNLGWATIVGGAVISDTPPAGPLTPGQLWWESDTGNTYLWFDDGDTQQWVQQNIQPAPPVGGVPVGTIRTVTLNVGSGSYVKPVGLKYVRATLVGGGGGSSTAPITAAGEGSSGAGGGAGATCIKLIAASDLAASEPYVVGAGGVLSGGLGTNGGNTTFAGMVAGGGSGAATAMAASASNFIGSYAGGTATGGDVNIAGGDSGTGSVGTISGQRVFRDHAACSYFNSPWGANYASTGAGAGLGSQPGRFPGGGALPAMCGPSNASPRNGASGGAGVIWLEEYF